MISISYLVISDYYNYYHHCIILSYLYYIFTLYLLLCYGRCSLSSQSHVHAMSALNRVVQLVSRGFVEARQVKGNRVLKGQAFMAAAKRAPSASHKLPAGVGTTRGGFAWNSQFLACERGTTVCSCCFIGSPTQQETANTEREANVTPK